MKDIVLFSRQIIIDPANNTKDVVLVHREIPLNGHIPCAFPMTNEQLPSRDKMAFLQPLKIPMHEVYAADFAYIDINGQKFVIKSLLPDVDSLLFVDLSFEELWVKYQIFARQYTNEF